MNKKIKVAVIGVGRWGRILLREFNQQAHVTYAFHKGSAETSQMLAREYPDLVVADSLNQILRDKSVQAIIIATPTETHCKIAMRVLKAGKHIFLEKPGCESYDKLEELAVEADRQGLRMAIGYEFFHHPALRKLRALVKPEEIKALHFFWQKWGTFRDNPIPHLASHAISIAMGLGFYDFTLSSKSVQGAVSESDIVRCELLLDDNIDFFIDINRVVPETKSWVLTVITKSGSFTWNNDLLFQIMPEQEKPVPIELSKISPVQAEIEDFLAAIGEDRQPAVDVRFGLDVWKVIEKIQSS